MDRQDREALVTIAARNGVWAVVEALTSIRKVISNETRLNYWIENGSVPK